MRKLTFFLLLLLLLLAGCGSQAKEEQKEKTDTPKEEEVKEQVTDKQPESQPEDETAEAVNQEQPLYRVNQNNWFIEPVGQANPQAVLLTIDDAPEKYALEMAKMLKAQKAPAIFFVNGIFLEKEENKQMLKEIADMGFEIGNHTYSHKDLKSLSEEEQRKEIIKVNEMVEEITGKRPVFFRAPFGSNTDFSKKLVQEEEMVLMNWTYGYDWEKEYMTKESLADVMVNTPLLANGANLLMHDRAWTKDALNDIIAGLRAKGYELIDPKTIQTEQSES